MQDFIGQLVDSLKAEQQAASQLLEVLQKEQDCLVSGDMTPLLELTDEKARIAVHMSSLSQQRYDMLTEAGHEAGKSGMEKWMQSEAPEVVRAAWKELLAVASAGKEHNRLNGVLIQQHMVRNQNALHVLFSHTQGGNFYGPDGQSTAKIGGRHLGAG